MMLKKIVSMSDFEVKAKAEGGGPEMCLTGSCPTIYETDNGEIVIQGFVMSQEDKAKIALAANEDAVIIPKELLVSYRR